MSGGTSLVLHFFPIPPEVMSRTTATVEMEPPVIGVGDHPEKKQSEKLAALSAVYQLQQLGVVRPLFELSARDFDIMCSSTTPKNCFLKVETNQKSHYPIVQSLVTNKLEISWIITAEDMVLENLKSPLTKSARAILVGRPS